MKFSIGDRVILKEDGTEAEVISLISSRIIEVLTSYGHELTILTQDVTFPQKKVIPQKETTDSTSIALTEPAPTKELVNGFYFSFQPVYSEDAHELTKLNLLFINRTHIAVILEFSATLDNNATLQQKLIIQASGKTDLASIPFEQLNGKPKFHYHICSLKEKTDWAEGNWFQFSNYIGLTPKKLFAYLNKMEAEKATSFELFLMAPKETTMKTSPLSDSSIKIPNKKRSIPQKIKSAPTKNQSFNEIDLHTESLNIPSDRLDNFTILSRQLQALEHAIDKAVLTGQTSLIIIHGVGKGKLKEEVHILLKGNSHVTFFQHSWRPKYGWGATEAFFK